MSICQLGDCVSPLRREVKNWKSQLNAKKNAREHGLSYFTYSGRFVPSKSFTFQPCNCRYKCSERVTFSERHRIFSNFWKSPSWDIKSNYIISCTEVTATKRSYVNNSRKKSSRVFKLNGVRVCKPVFLNTLGISNGRLNYCLNHEVNIGSKLCSPDKLDVPPS